MSMESWHTIEKWVSQWIYAGTSLRRPISCRGIDIKHVDEVSPPLALEIKRWYKCHHSITVWIETMIPEWTHDYTQVHPPYHLVCMIPNLPIDDWKIAISLPGPNHLVKSTGPKKSPIRKHDISELSQLILCEEA